MVWELLEKMKQIYNLYEQRQPLRGGGNHQNCHGNLKVLCWSKGGEPGEGWLCRTGGSALGGLGG